MKLVHSDRASQRLLLLIATLLRYPGVGCPDDDQPGPQHDAVALVRNKLLEVAQELKIDLGCTPSVPTIHKDLKMLRDYGILDSQMYRWGYYLYQSPLTLTELQIALQLIASVARYQGDPQTRQIFDRLNKRLKSWDEKTHGQLLYPVRQLINRSIVHTDPEEMMKAQENQYNLFHKFDLIALAISQCQAIEIERTKDLYGDKRKGKMTVWPLQLIYHDIAWYLAYEVCHNGHLSISRINRFSDRLRLINNQRNRSEQIQKLNQLHQLLAAGWGLSLGTLEEQNLELKHRVKLEKVQVRFFGEAVPFILEGKRRHQKQEVNVVKEAHGKPLVVDYYVKLPPRSFNEFLFWVNKHFPNAIILAPRELVEKQKKAIEQIQQRYDNLI